MLNVCRGMNRNEQSKKHNDSNRVPLVVDDEILIELEDFGNKRKKKEANVKFDGMTNVLLVTRRIEEVEGLVDTLKKPKFFFFFIVHISTIKSILHLNK